MIIIITPEVLIANECAVINSLMKTGNYLLHIRKHELDEVEMSAYIGAIDKCYRKKLVLHSHFHLAKEMGIERLHFKDSHRLTKKHELFKEDFILSTSVHSIEDFNNLDCCWNYAFLSPVFPSISKKGYGKGKHILQQLKKKQHASVKLIGLGGIDEHNVRTVIKAGADGVAILGALWLHEQPEEAFLKIQQALK